MVTSLKKIIRIVVDKDRAFDERIFLLLTLLAEMALLLVFIADIFLQENIAEIITIGITLLWNPILVYFCVKHHKVEIGSLIVCFAVVFLDLPVVFFFGGGLTGGGILWFSFAYVYIGLLLHGRMRNLMLILLSCVAVAVYVIGFTYPWLVTFHDNQTMFIDSLASILVVGVLLYAMVLFQSKVYKAENERAKLESEKVERLNQAQNNFFSNMSHEIRTPINTIVGLNEMILRENVSDEVAEDAINIQVASRMLLHLINDILDMSKLESGQMQLTPVPYHPDDMLSEIAALLWIKAQQKHLDFVVDISPRIPSMVEGDEVRIRQILVNVLNNAIKYTSEGSVKISVEVGDEIGDRVNLIYTISDTGQGIRKENIPYLFTAFKRVDEEKNRYIEGTGLGLSIVKQLVDKMDGKITVNSVYTKGSTFIIEIPQVVIDEREIGEISIDRRADTSHRETYKRKFEAPDAKVLVVDDNETNLLVTKKLLRDTRVQVETVSSGAEALKQTLSQEYHVILMDHLMPEMDGITCMKLIHEQIGGMSKKAKVVALTANAGTENQKLYEKEGFDGYLVKPVNGTVLESELLRLLPRDLIQTTSDEGDILEDTIQWMQSDQRKRRVAITTESVADIPEQLLKDNYIAVLPHKVRTSEGVFEDGVEIETRGILAYMENPQNTFSTEVPSVAEHEEFFARQLVRANNIIHVTISSKVTTTGYFAAKEAADSFDNVYVFDSRHLSAGQGFVAIVAAHLAGQGLDPQAILEELDHTADRIHSGFMVDDMNHLARAGQVSSTIAHMTSALMLRVSLVMKNGKLKPEQIFIGGRERSIKNYLIREVRNMINVDTTLLVIVHTGLSQRELDLIRNEICQRIQFADVAFQETSPAVSSNCGKGTFGLFYWILN